MKNRKIKVNDLILRFKELALLLNKDPNFDPMRIKRIRLAAFLDKNAFNRRLFYIYKAFINQKN
ncbi:MAG: hypothetical protein J7497_13175, partial [Chitinophagaceae bacterium]|nr:hypothetical protein [Chitinophagaceae bacterium]